MASTFHFTKINAVALGFVQHLVAVIASGSENWNVLQNNDFQMLLGTGLCWILSRNSQVLLFIHFQVMI